MPQAAPDPEYAPPLATPWLTRNEAAARARMSQQTIYAATADGSLRCSGGGGSGQKILIHVDWLDDWIQRRNRS